MGLDAVELVMGVEEAFSISLEDEELEKAQTVGTLHQLVLQKLKASDKQSCLSMATFHILRRAFISALGAARKDACLTSPLEQMIGNHEIKRCWLALKTNSGLKLARLELSRDQHLLVGSLTMLVLTAVVAFAFFTYEHFSTIYASTFFIPIAFALLFYMALAPFANRVPKKLNTLADLVHDTLARNYAEIVAKKGAASEQEVWSILCTIISQQLGVERENIRPESKFIGELLP